jgi:hypothetical protein
MDEVESAHWAQPRKIQEVEYEVNDSKNSEAEKIQRAKWLLRRAFKKQSDDVEITPWILHPESRLRHILTSAALVASVYTVFVEAYLVSFDVRPLPTFTLLLSCVADMVLAADFAANFITGYKWLASDGTWHLDMRPIPSMINYLTTWCFFDIWGILPIQLIFTLVDPFGRLLYPAPMFLRILEVLKCLKVLRIISEFRSWENNSSANFGTWTLFKSLSGFLLLVHWWACAWFWTVKESERILRLYPEEPSVCTDRMKLLEAGDGEQYLCAVYWAVQIVTTTGNGDMVPQTDAERTFSLFAMIAGVCLFLIFVVTIHSLVADARSHHQCFQDEVNATTAYLRSRNVPQRLLKEMEEHYSYQWRLSKGYDDIACLSRLPLSVQMRAFQLMHGALVSSVEFLTVRPPSDMAFWGMFLEELKTEIVSPNTWIYREGDPADCVYLVKDGLVSSPTALP